VRTWSKRARPKLGTIAGTRYLGTANVLGKDVQLWDTQQGTVMVPLMTTVAAKEADTRVQRVSSLATLLRTNTDRSSGAGRGRD